MSPANANMFRTKSPDMWSAPICPWLPCDRAVSRARYILHYKGLGSKFSSFMFENVQTALLEHHPPLGPFIYIQSLIHGAKHGMHTLCSREQL